MDYIKILTASELRGYLREVIVTQQVIDILRENNIVFDVQEFINYYPQEIFARVIADGQEIKALNTGFVGGKATKENIRIIDSVLDEELDNTMPNINYNPASKEAISRPCNYNTVSVAIHVDDVEKVKNAKELSIETSVQKTSYLSKNILVGNKQNPKRIIFAHLDSVGGEGAVDNASGSAFCINLILEKPELLHDNLFVISGNEEISYDLKPMYWGFGYRMFEKEYKQQMDNAEKIIVADCVGYDKPNLITDEATMALGLPLADQSVFHKSVMVSGDFTKLMDFYHCEADNKSKISEDLLNECYMVFKEQVLK